jgi:hypothetical protein
MNCMYVFYYFSNSISDFLGFPWWHNTVQRYCMLSTKLTLTTIPWEKNLLLYVCMYVCIRGGPLRPLHCDPQWSIVLSLSLVIPSAIPHFERNAGFCTWGRRNSHLVPWNIDPGGEILNKLGPYIHTGYVWLFHFLSDTYHSWDCYLVPVWRAVRWGDSVL